MSDRATRFAMTLMFLAAFAVPSWAALEHEASEPADLFSIDDRPVFESLGLYRETTLDRPQTVRCEFARK